MFLKWHVFPSAWNAPPSTCTHRLPSIMSIDSWGSFPRPFLPLEFVTTLFATLLMLLVPLCCVLVFIFGHHSLDGGSEICFFPCLFLVLPWIKCRCYIFIDFLILLPGHVVGTFLSGSRHLVNCEGTRKACPFDHSRLLSRSCLGSVTLYHLSQTQASSSKNNKYYRLQVVLHFAHLCEWHIVLS